MESPVTLQVKHQSLLIYLVVERRPVSRAELAGRFWSDSPEARARGSLSQSLHVLRRELPGIVNAHGSAEVCVDDGLIDCDLWALQDAIQQHDYSRAVHLYHGEFLPGFTLHGCPSFDDWMSRVRKDVEIELCDAAWKAADSAESLDDAANLLNVARTAQPYNEAVLRRLLLVQLELGNPNAALRAYEDFRRLIADELGTTPTSETREVANLLLHATEEDEPPSTANCCPVDIPCDTHEPVEASSGARLRHQPWHGVRSAVIVTTVLSVCGLAGYLLSSRVAANPAPVAGLITVDSLGYVKSDGESVALAGIVRERLFDYRLLDARGESSPPLTVSGAARESPAGVRIETRIHRGTSIISSDVYLTGHTSELHVARVAAERVQRQLAFVHDVPIRNRQLLQIATLLADATAHRKSGSFANSDFDLGRAEDLLKSIPLQDRGIAWQLLLSSKKERLAWNYLMTGRRDAAIKEFDDSFRTLQELESPPSTVLARMAELQYSRSLTAEHDADALLDSAVELSRQSLRLQPHNGRAWLALSEAQFALGRYLDALTAANKARRLLPFMESDLQLAVRLFLAAFNSGKDPVATQECHRIQSIDPDNWPAVSCAAMLYGWTDSDGLIIDLLEAAESLPSTPAVVAANGRKTQMLVASALAQRDGLVQSHVFDTIPADADSRVFWIAWRSLADISDASIYYADLLRSPGGIRASRTYARLLEPLATAATHSPMASNSP